METGNREVKVWDLFVRLGHWSLVAAFAIAYLSAEEAEDLHVAAGYWIGAYLLARTVWGFIGPQHARFSDFVYRPQAVFAYLRGLLQRRAAHYLGHNPAGGAMVIALLLCLAGTVGTGLLELAADEHEGPLASWFAASPTPAIEAPAAENEAQKDEEPESAYKELHEVFANLSLALIALHILGVMASSLVDRENLPRAMITGRKKVP